MKKNRIGLKITALGPVLRPAGRRAVGGGVAWAVGHGTSSTSINVSDRTVSQVAVQTVDGKTEMSDAEVYAANVNSVVSINVTRHQRLQLLRASRCSPPPPAPASC